jgi:hypothetical protein
MMATMLVNQQGVYDSNMLERKGRGRPPKYGPRGKLTQNISSFSRSWCVVWTCRPLTVDLFSYY